MTPIRLMSFCVNEIDLAMNTTTARFKLIKSVEILMFKICTKMKSFQSLKKLLINYLNKKTNFVRLSFAGSFKLQTPIFPTSPPSNRTNKKYQHDEQILTNTFSMPRESMYFILFIIACCLFCINHTIIFKDYLSYLYYV